MSSLDATLLRWDEEEHRLLMLLAEADRAVLADRARLSLAAVSETARRELRQSRERIALLVETYDDA